MARFSLGARMTSAPTSTLPGMSLYSATGVQWRLREVGIYNTTTTACVVALQYLTSTGTVGAALTEMEWDGNGPAATVTGVNTHTIAPTITTGELVRATLGAAAGASMIWTFGDYGLVIPSGTANGIGITCPTGTGQVCDVYWFWEE